MTQSGSDAGTEFVLDNRKLIIGFLLLIIICGAFFAVGFLEGKRQVLQTKTEQQAPPSPATPSAAAGSGEVKTSAQAKAAPAEDRSVRDQLDWYKAVKGTDATSSGSGNVSGARKEAPSPGVPSRSQNEGSKPVGSAKASSTKSTYTVQVGAFRQRREADIKADALKAKGYDFVVKTPASADGLFLVQVGVFNSKPEAVAMEKKLMKDGFDCILKTYETVKEPR